MIYLVYGGSASGKSAFAEKLLTEFPDGDKYYIATMMAREDDADAQKRITRHRKMREGKGFKTIEEARNLEKITLPASSSALLECMSNLCANEMFDGLSGKQKSEDEVVEKILAGVKSLSSILKNLVIVTNNIFEDSVQYDEATQSYIRALGKINCELAKISDKVYEVVVGIPVELK
ncbi:bifunctional adenosylcobinamide kinase/adenosylcobinamide-phosphate guanylyltransferase [Treponema sp. C6A8]|uniref:bifunctional adenosylcobinamide kinase/adenosylcobinamide-phosphate guanylyltransferase n=1 Tax=Treponema sp. C6A8 TaxID=1410609 RepID=UPI00048708AE|nr:bifunctional adenosylcobinamide kinase/adenosylcobinamide-phosphate guanylyltransferase [Treponema sp. C6A8]